MTRRVDVSHQVHFPDALPDIIWLVVTAGSSDAGVRAKQIDLAVSIGRSLDEIDNVSFNGDVSLHREAFDFFREGFSAFIVEVGDHDGSSTFSGEPLAQSPSDAVCTAGHDRNSVFESHLSLCL